MTDTIFAVSSGSPPAAIGIIRVSGPSAGIVIRMLTGSTPEPRRAALRTLRNSQSQTLDQALILWFPGPRTATGEDLLELHCHGGKAVLGAVSSTLAAMPGLRQAEPGEFTRRAFANGVIDLAQAEGLGELLSAETELQRLAAQGMAGGSLSRRFDYWRDTVLQLSAQVEAVLDFDDEDDVTALDEAFFHKIEVLLSEWQDALNAPPIERLRNGIRVVLAGPPNSGKSSLFNALLDEGAAIVSAQAGTTRDFIERSVAIGGVPFVLVDTAGIRENEDSEIEKIGIERAQGQISKADVVLWLGEPGIRPEGSWRVRSFADLPGHEEGADFLVSAETKQGVAELTEALVAAGRDLCPKPNQTSLNSRQMEILMGAKAALSEITPPTPPLVVGEMLRTTRTDLDRLTGRQSTELMLDSLFGRFCIGK